MIQQFLNTHEYTRPSKRMHNTKHLSSFSPPPSRASNMSSGEAHAVETACTTCYAHNTTTHHTRNAQHTTFTLHTQTYAISEQSLTQPLIDIIARNDSCSLLKCDPRPETCRTRPPEYARRGRSCHFDRPTWYTGLVVCSRLWRTASSGLPAREAPHVVSSLTLSAQPCKLSMVHDTPPEVLGREQVALPGRVPPMEVAGLRGARNAAPPSYWICWDGKRMGSGNLMARGRKRAKRGRNL